MTFPHGYHTVRATLTGTSNPYLVDQLPITGELTVHETTTDHRPMNSKVTFRADDTSKQGGLGAPVHVEDAEWVVTSRRSVLPSVLTATGLAALFAETIRRIQPADPDDTIDVSDLLAGLPAADLDVIRQAALVLADKAKREYPRRVAAERTLPTT